MSEITETTDAAANASTAYSMAVGDVFLGHESQNGADWIRITLTAGVTYSFGMVGLGADGSGVADPLIRLRTAGGVLLAQDDDGGPGLTAGLTYAALTSGTFYLEARSLSGAVNGAYGLSVTAGALPSFGAELAAGVLYRFGATWAAGPGQPATLSWGVRGSGPAEDAQGNPASFSVLSPAQIAAAEAALQDFAGVAGLTFNRVNPGGTTQSATLLLGGYTSEDDGAGAYAEFPGSTAASSSAGDVWINNWWISDDALPLGSYDRYVFLHELGHALGLDHPGDYNAAPGATISYDTAAQFVQDSQQFTVMSYFAATDTAPGAPSNYCDTLMLYDIFALQAMYGVNAATRAGNDTYGFGSSLGGAYDFTQNADPLMCIWDGGGTDVLNLSGFGGRQVVNLNDGQFSDVGGYVGNLSIAWGAMIENAVGGRGSDRITGNEGANVLRGGAGRDVLAGAAGSDRLAGNGGQDRFVFGSGDGQDRIVDFDPGLDLISLGRGLWGGGVRAIAQILEEFAVIRNGIVVLDFGADELVLQGMTTIAGLEERILTF
jgi:serralysin